jgi:hypothetical protein
MSTEPAPTPAPSPPAQKEITIVSHSTLVYWWPVWAVGFLLGILTQLFGARMATVPSDTRAGYHADVSAAVKNEDGSEMRQKFEDREVLILPEKQHLRRADNGPPDKAPDNPRLHIWPRKGFGVLFASVLLLVIVITNVPLRGMWSVMIIVLTIMLSVIFALANLWGPILYHLGQLDVRINAGGYFFISGILFLVWLVTFFFFDKQIYMIFTPGMFKVCTEIGGGENTYDTVGITLQKQRSDLFRHWLLGLGSGDLIVKTTGAQAHQFDFPNVLFIGKKVSQIETMLKTKAVIEAR